jgi:2-hydroxy-palmitic acid dioxygenase Mpo1-like
MREIFRRQLADYANYHRDPRNCAMHVVGNPILFLAAVLPLSSLPVTAFGLQANMAVLLVMPALILRIVLDLTIGLAIVAADCRPRQCCLGLDNHCRTNRHRLGLANCWTLIVRASQAGAAR